MLHQLHADEGVLPGELRDDLRQQLQAALDGDAHADAAVDFLLRFGDFAAQVALDIQHLLRGVDVLLAGEGQGDGIGAAVENCRAQILLDLLDRLGERRLGNEQSLAGRGDGAFTKDGQNIMYVFRIRKVSLPCARITDEKNPVFTSVFEI